MFVWFVQKLNSSGGLSKVRFVEFCSDSENENFESFAAKKRGVDFAFSRISPTH